MNDTLSYPNPQQNQNNKSDPKLDLKAVTVPRLQAMKNDGEKIAMLTCYDASFAALLDAQGVDVLLIGDSLGMVMQGKTSTLHVSLDEVAYHTAAVARGSKHCLILADMPYGSYHESPEQAYRNAAKLMQSGAHMVKCEGGAWVAPTIEFLVTRGIPVCAHHGLMPQRLHQMGGYKVQGRDEASAQQLLQDCQLLQNAGASMVLLEAIPHRLAEQVTKTLSVPTIGIGAGASCSGQVLVLYDMLNVYPGRKARFVKNYVVDGRDIGSAVSTYVSEVKAGVFPGPEHCFE